MLGPGAANLFVAYTSARSCLLGSRLNQTCKQTKHLFWPWGGKPLGHNCLCQYPRYGSPNLRICVRALTFPSVRSRAFRVVLGGGDAPAAVPASRGRSENDQIVV